MKKLSIIVFSVLVALASCTKSKEVHPEIGDGNDEIVTVGLKDVHIKYLRTDHAELSRVVFHYSLAETQQFTAVEMTKRETFFDLTLNDLLSETSYRYYYELFYDGSETSITEQKTFRMQVVDVPIPPTPPSDAPEGAINGLFSVSPTQKVYFSQGNLQYQASTNTWRFAEHQWDYVGDETQGTVYENGVKCNNSLISSTYNGWIDLFGWGTSGYNHGAVCYQPWSVSQNNNDYYAYGLPDYSLFDQSGKADWGYNAISNGGNQEGFWHTLTREEINYIFYTRNTLSGIRYAKARVNDVPGMIVLPDNWSSSIYTLFDTNSGYASYNSNIIDNTTWMGILEPNGAVFLPITFDRVGLSYWHSGEEGLYWLATSSGNGNAYNTYFTDSGLSTDDDNGDCDRYVGRAVRLVHDANP